jgi:hypothetical protein
MSRPGAALVAGPTGTVGCGAAVAVEMAPGVVRAGAAVSRLGNAVSAAGSGATEASTPGVISAGFWAGT